MPAQTFEDDLAALKVILRRHKITGDARKEIIEFATTLNSNATGRGAGMVFNAQQKIDDDWHARYDRLSKAGIYPVVRVLRHGLNAVNGGSRGYMWVDAKSDELMRAADRIITSDDEAMKAKLIAACGEVR